MQDTADQPVSSGSGVVAPAVLDRRLARRADIALTVPDVDAAAARVRSIAAAKRATELGIEAYNILEGFEGDPDAQGHRGQKGGWRLRGLPWKQN